MLNKKHVALCFFSSCLVVTLFMNVTASQNIEPYDYMSTNAMVDALDARVHMQPQKGFITVPVAAFSPCSQLSEYYNSGNQLRHRAGSNRYVAAFTPSAQEKSSLLRKLPSIPFESLLAFHTTEIVCFSFMFDVEFGCFFVQNHAANRISRHYLTPHPCACALECCLDLAYALVLLRGFPYDSR